MQQQLKKLRLWLTPGMKVKRYIFVLILGTLLLILGAVLLFIGYFYNSIYLLLTNLFANPQGFNTSLIIAFAIFILGIVVTIRAVRSLNHSLLSSWTTKPSNTAAIIHQRLSLSKGPKIVALGGGTGLSNLLRGLRQHTSNITAVVTVSDDGGSSGRLRSAFDIPPPGDLVDCLAALSDNELHVSQLLKYRFKRGNELKGHTFGNLFITTLTEVEGNFVEAIRLMNSLLNICGAVYPISPKPITLRAKKNSGQWVTGESYIRKVAGAIDKVTIEPHDPPLVPEVVLAIEEADIIVLGPGSLFSSTLPSVLVPECKKALLNTTTPIVYICNVMTETGETDNYSVWDHVRTLGFYLGKYPNCVVVNSTPIDTNRLKAYQVEHAKAVSFEPTHFESRKIEVAHIDILSEGEYAQHSPQKLASWLINFTNKDTSSSGQPKS